MKKRLLSLFLAFVTLLGILPTAALAANTEEEALGEVDIYNGGYELSYPSKGTVWSTVHQGGHQKRLESSLPRRHS